MFIVSYGKLEHDVYALCVNGDRIGLSSRDLARFMLSLPFVAFTLVFVIALAAVTTEVYGFRMDLPDRIAVWGGNAVSVGLIWFLHFWAVELIARRLGRSLITISFGMHIMAAMVTVTVGTFLIGGIDCVFQLLSREGIWQYTKNFCIAEIYELVIVLWIWPGNRDKYIGPRSAGAGAETSTYHIEVDRHSR